MSGKWGGGGTKCTSCEKTVYPAETIQMEKKPYHVECFRCSVCSNKMESGAKAEFFENTLFCKSCFKKGGFAQKQKKVLWTKKEADPDAPATKSKFGGGGNPCEVCAKTVYSAETVSFDKKIFHSDCFKCTKCTKVLTVSGAAAFENEYFCTKCFKEGGYTQKQASTARAGGGGGGGGNSAIASKFGGGGTKCTKCDKTVYSAEQVSYDKAPYHADCFTCSVETCGKKLTPSGAAAFEGAMFCTKCFKEGGYSQKQAKTTTKSTSTGNSAIASKFGGGGNKCVRCNKTVYPAETVSFEKNFFHAECLTCMACDKKLTSSNAEGKKTADGGVDTYCKKCFQEKGLNRAQLDKKPEEEGEAAAEAEPEAAAEAEPEAAAE